MVFVIRRRQRYGSPFLSRAAGSADTVNIKLAVLRNVIVINMSYTFNIKAARSNVSRNEHLKARVSKALHDLLTLRLSQIAMQLIGFDTEFLKLLVQFLCANLRPAKNNGQIGLMTLKQMNQRLLLASVCRFIDDLRNAVQRYIRAAYANIDRRFSYNPLPICEWHQASLRRTASFDAPLAFAK